MGDVVPFVASPRLVSETPAEKVQARADLNFCWEVFKDEWGVEAAMTWLKLTRESLDMAIKEIKED